MDRIKIGTSIIDITAPLELGILMSSVKELYVPFKGVRLPLKGRILILEHKKETAAIISLDLLGISDTAIGGWEAFKEKFSDIMPADNIIFTCTHTHSSPETAGLTELYKAEKFKKWLNELEHKIKEGLRLSIANLQECEVSIGISELKGYSLQRRIHSNGKIIMSDSVQPIDQKYFELGPIDNRIKAVKFTNSGNKNVVTIVQYACHPVHEMCSSYVSPDFAGELCLDLEKQDTNGMVMFLNGACGDINPPTVSEGAVAAANHGKAIADRVRNMVWTKQNIDDIKIINSKLNFKIRENSGITSIEDGICRIITLALGNIAFVFLSGENFVDTASAIEENSPYKTNIVVGYAENYVGYIPPKRVFEEGGYETGPGKWSYLEEDAQEQVTKEVIQMLHILK